MKTNTTTGGQVIGLGGDSYVDRSLYMTNTGQLAFVVYDGSYDAVTSTGAALNDSQWHLVTGTLDGAGMKLYVDGAVRASPTDVTSAWYQYGSWRIGGEKTSGYPVRSAGQLQGRGGRGRDLPEGTDRHAGRRPVRDRHRRGVGCGSAARRS